jgi:hypothetical protein
VTPVTSVGAPPGASVTSKLERHNQKMSHPLFLPISPFKKRYFPPIQTYTGAPLAPFIQIFPKNHYKEAYRGQRLPFPELSAESVMRWNALSRGLPDLCAIILSTLDSMACNLSALIMTISSSACKVPKPWL